MSVVIEPETARLRLRQWRAADRAPFAALNADPRVMAFFPATLDRAQSDAMAARCEELIARMGWGLWAVETRDEGRFIGCVGLYVSGDALPFFPCVEIAWRLARDHWGRGYATEAAQAALRVGFEEVGLPEIVSFAALGNMKSRAVMMRIGLRDTGITFPHPEVPAGSALREHCLYRMTNEEWTTNPM